MKTLSLIKGAVLFVFLLISEQAMSQWTELPISFNCYSVWLKQPNDGWAFGKEFWHYDGSGWTSMLNDSLFGGGTCGFSSIYDGWVFSFWQDSAYRYDGTSFTKQYVGFTATNCHFSDSSYGWAVSSSGPEVYQYSSGTWNTFSGHLFNEAASYGTNTGWSICGHDLIMRDTVFQFSNNQWVLDTVFDSTKLAAVAFTDSLHGWVGGNNYSLGSVIYKYDGQTWNLELSTGEPSGFLEIFMFNENLGWATTKQGYIYRYNGLSWTLQDTIIWCVKQLSFADSLHGWAFKPAYCGPAYDPMQLAYTDNGGVGLEEHKCNPNFSEVNVYPNPTSGKVTIEILRGQSFTYSIINIIGASVTKTTYCPNIKQDIDISYLPAGIYILEVNGDAWTETKKLVRE